MSASRITTRMPVPPPRQFQLLDGTGLVGWIDANRLEITGFADPAEAAAAAWVAHVALERRRAKWRQEDPPRLEAPQLFLARSAGQDWITGAGKRLARLVRPNLQDNSRNPNDAAAVSTEWFGIEIEFPADTSGLTVGSSAHVVYLALRRSGVRWSARSRESVPAAMPARTGLVAGERAHRVPMPAAARPAYASLGG